MMTSFQEIRTAGLCTIKSPSYGVVGTTRRQQFCQTHTKEEMESVARAAGGAHAAAGIPQSRGLAQLALLTEAAAAAAISLPVQRRAGAGQTVADLTLSRRKL